MKRIAAVTFTIAGVVTAVVTPPASAQFGNPGWGADVEVLESAGEVVLTLEFGGTGQVKYRTIDGSCPPSPCDPQARAPEDYTAVSGEVVFTHPGSKTISIPIVDDDLAEGRHEAFTVHAVEEPNPDPWPFEGDRVVVRIIDDEADGSGVAADTRITTTTVRGRGSIPTPAAAPPATSATPVSERGAPTTTASSRELEATDLRAGPGFELTSDRPPESRPLGGRGGGSGGSASWLVFGSGAAVLSVGALALVRHRRQWSPTAP